VIAFSLRFSYNESYLIKEKKMIKLDAEVIARQYATSVVEIGLARSAESLGYENHAFALGYTQSDIRILLEDLNLNQRQLKILSQRVL
jgi:DNA-binding transcriptional regulator YiaG